MPTPKDVDHLLRDGAAARATVGILAVIITVDGVDPNDPEGNIPLDKLLNGTIARVPRWENYSSDPANPDHLRVYWEQNGVKSLIHDGFYTPVDVLEIEVPISAAQMSTDGIAWLSYEVNDADVNPDPAPPRKLTIDHTQVPVQELKEAQFPHATLWGYLNCATRPPLSSGVTVKIPAQTFGRPDDLCLMEWQGYEALNAKVPIGGTFGEFQKLLNTEDILNGFELVVPFAKYVKDIKFFDDERKKDVFTGSALVIYRYYRGGRLVGESTPALVKIDRVLSGEVLPCYFAD
ncbi:hypothetical protein [Pseudomonas sp. 6D_7.1_Bac1]|uniref:hypothetical protein n=1 Tax=Pseudomonas sp. 6D_7.1_Bac1 TaxID=2971615 RepID=UPI0021C74C7F|nr:hypothetical protein [Pseudomonas sp. 6D_7.1_Bac1]MCU1750311.1 hypothetical protein [Pseudomonas sp. 6D_7.1_Bac1]